MNTKIKIISGVVGLAVIAGVWTFLPTDPSITLNNPQKISWVKPTTNTEWAEDVKAENFDIKSTEVLQEMRDSHAEKLQRIIDNGKKIVECPTCIKYDLQANNPDWTQTDVDNEYTNQLSQYQWDIEKLTQSVERMDNEIRLRANGFVVPDKNRAGVKTKKTDLDKVLPDKIRHIND